MRFYFNEETSVWKKDIRIELVDGDFILIISMVEIY
jgi:hypothetical protein